MDAQTNTAFEMILFGPPKTIDSLIDFNSMPTSKSLFFPWGYGIAFIILSYLYFIIVS